MKNLLGNKNTTSYISPTMNGQELKILRETAGLTQKELAEKIGTQYPRISDWETGKRKISAAYRRILTDFFQ